MDVGNFNEIAFSMTVQRYFQCQSLKSSFEREKLKKACDA